MRGGRCQVLFGQLIGVMPYTSVSQTVGRAPLVGNRDVTGGAPKREEIFLFMPYMVT